MKNIRIEFDAAMNPSIIDYENGVRADVLYDERGRYWDISYTVNGERVDVYADTPHELSVMFRIAQGVRRIHNIAERAEQFARETHELVANLK